MRSIALIVILMSSSLALASGKIEALSPIKLPRPSVPPPTKISPDSMTETKQGDVVNEILCANGVIESCG